MNDLISRQAAIDALFALYEYQRSFDPTEAADLVRQGIFLAEKKIEKLPSAQPGIIHCGDCRYWKNNHLCECLSKYGTFETEIYFYCGFAERRTDE